MKDEKEKLEIRKKPQEVKKEDLDKVGGGEITGYSVRCPTIGLPSPNVKC